MCVHPTHLPDIFLKNSTVSGVTGPRAMVTCRHVDSYPLIDSSAIYSQAQDEHMIEKLEPI